ncbi:hypothetical protein POM88_021997 [Heracleum sosnowskyi]|uniref:RNase III domain-containing protein n=1 Tax=Heracleum sosnowskyi TaxID=360622 RepID=A0AAD8IE68_9APIA|nr:hypothetical protein POM88_021997 [Heracleum sosnowskyi]
MIGNSFVNKKTGRSRSGKAEHTPSGKVLFDLGNQRRCWKLKKCQEKFDLESLEALGDSFLKYAACQQGLIRNEPFDPQTWINQIEDFREIQLSTGTKVFTKGIRKIKSKVVEDVVEPLFGVFLSYGGEVAALSFMNWLVLRYNVSSVNGEM